ncbi:hypothetical protein R1sor_008587 [Riccia sorocarpa]|uniref:Reverse transcriptase zinc-binding domain-containing protein n=1 Tax=Riccia sorocarpa TaxID=122646 RepID=A0ABD3HVJ2_9MARC
MTTFVSQDARLIPIKLCDLPSMSAWTRTPVATCWISQAKPPTRFLVSWDDKLARLLSGSDYGPRKGRSSFPPYNGIYFTLLCPQMYGVPQSSRDHEDTWCKCCPLRAAEDIVHLFWECPAATQIWSWAVNILHIAFPDTRTWTPRFRHAVLGAEIPDSCKLTVQWWEKWRIIVLWTIWIQRNNCVFRDDRPSQLKAKALAWHRLLLQTRRNWKRHYLHVANQDLTLARRAEVNKKAARKLALVTLRFRTDAYHMSASWRPP